MTASLDPPHLAERLLRAALAATPYRDDILGDLHETFAALTRSRSAAYARWWYRIHAARLAGRYAWRWRPAPKRGHAMDRLQIGRAHV